MIVTSHASTESLLPGVATHPEETPMRFRARKTERTPHALALKGQWQEEHGWKAKCPKASQRGIVVPLVKKKSPSTSAKAQEHVFRREGEYWTIVYAGETFRVKDAKGLRYLSLLLQAPYTFIHVLHLASIVGGAQEEHALRHGRNALIDAGLSYSRLEETDDILDARAREEYKRRLHDLIQELEEAQAFSDLGRIDRIRSEMDMIERELTHAVGQGGRPRPMSCLAERARVNVTRAVKGAMKKILTHSPSLGQHLKETIHTGMFCSYTPEIHWKNFWQC